MLPKGQGSRGPARPSKRPAPSSKNDGPPANKKFKPSKSSNSTQVKHNATPKDKTKMTKKERKQLHRERKSRRQKNFDLIQEGIVGWEALRRHDTPAARRTELVQSLLRKLDGRLAELAASPTASRVVQALIKYGSETDRANILKQLEPQLLELAKNAYARFVLSKLINVATKDQLQVFLKAFKGHAAELLRHPAGAHVLDDFYTTASAAHRNELAAEFYGREYSLFAGGTLNELQGIPASLPDLLAAVDGAKRRGILQHLTMSISPVIEKGLVDCQLAHRLIAEHMASAPASLVADTVGSLSGEALLHMMHTRHGATAACMVLAYGTAKERKQTVRVLKGHVQEALKDEWGHLPIVTALSVVDDTALLNKFIIGEIKKDLSEYVRHKTAHRVVLQLLHPDSPWYLPPSLASIVRPEPKILQTSSEAGDATEGDKGEPEMDVKEASEDEGDGDDEDAEVAVRPSGPLGLSKKDANLRRKELLVGSGLGKALVTLCTDSAAELLATQHAADILIEVCRGGEGGLLEELVGEESIDEVQAATVAAAVAKNGSDESNGEQLLQNFFGSRALRRLVLASKDEGRAGNAAQRFVKLLWERALKGRCAELHASHAAKILGAVVLSACPAVSNVAVLELKKCGVADVPAWADTFTVRANKNK